MKKKILHICNTSFYLEKFLKSHIEFLSKSGYDVHVLCDLSNNNLNISNDIILHDIKFPRSISIFGFIRSIIYTTKLIRKNKYDLVISHNRGSSVVGRIATYFAKLPINLYFAHGFYFHDNQNFFTYYITVQIERLLQIITSHTMSQSSEDIDYMINKGYLPKQRATYVGNGINNIKFKPLEYKLPIRKKLGMPQNCYIIAAVGRLVKGKGFQDLIKAFSMIEEKEECYLLIVGGNISQDISKYEQYIIHLISKYNLEHRVMLTGMVENVEEYLAASDLFVLSSYREGVSRSMLEAMSCKIPVISTNIRGSREIIQNKINGLLYTKSDTEELYKLIMNVKNDKMLKNQLISNAFNILNSFYTEELYNRRQIKTIMSVLN